jgi:hypothetical protein
MGYCCSENVVYSHHSKRPANSNLPCISQGNDRESYELLLELSEKNRVLNGDDWVFAETRLISSHFEEGAPRLEEDAGLF